MPELQACRICLRSSLRLYHLDKYSLKNYYEEIVTLPVYIDDNLPRYVCYECAALLHKFHNFREKCYYSYNTLSEKFWNKKVTLASISKINSNPTLKYGNLEILSTSHRVSTFIVHHPTVEEVSTSEPVKEEFIKDNDDDICLAQINSENINKKPEVKPNSPEIELDFNDFDNDIEVIEFEDNESKTDTVKLRKQPKRKVAKDTKAKPAKQPRKRVNRKKKKEKIDSEEDESGDDSKKETSKAKEAKDYKFNQSNEGKLKVLKFLESGFWKRTNLSEEEAMAEFQAKAQDRKYLRAAYKCTDCYRGFSQKNMLDRHIPLRHGEGLGSLVCRFCKTRFKFAYFLNKHMKQHFTRYECLRCNLVCNLDKSALYHEEYHNGVIRKCPHCDQEFKHLSTFYTHLRTHRSKHMCTRCGESFVSPRGLYLHKKVKHINVVENEVVDVEDSTYCDICKIKFETSDAYTKHLTHSAMHTDEKMPGENLDKENSDEDEAEKDDGDNQESEELYTRRSRVEKTLSAVRKRDLNRSTSKCAKKPTTCQHCGKHFETQKACMQHHHAEHPRKPFYTPKERVICEICGISLAPSSVPAHLNHHTHRKMFTCDTCGKSFTTNNVLKNHMATHTGERNHPCNMCGKRFAQSGSLHLHYKTIHLKQPYPKRNRKKKIEEPITEGGPFNGKDDHRVWRHYFENSAYSNS